MKKRVLNKSQVSVFIIIAVVIVAATGIAYVINRQVSTSNLDNKFFSSSEIKPSVDNIRNSIQNCIEDICHDALFSVGLQGGYYHPPLDNSFNLQWMSIPYYYNQGKIQVPSKETIEKEMSSLVDDNLGYCFDIIDDNGFNLSYTKPVTKAKILPGKIDFIINSKFSIEKESNLMTYELKTMPISFDRKVYEMIDIAKYISNSHKKNPEIICINCIDKMAEQKGLYVDYVEFIPNESISLVIITDSIINKSSENSYIFEFLNKYPRIKQEDYKFFI